MTVLIFAGLIVLSYFLGAIPFSLIVSKSKHVDLTKIGSGNLGATNVYRALGFKWAFLVFLLDAVKGFIPTFLAVTYLSNSWLHIIIGFTAIAGHSLSIFVKFKGGKGVATAAGVLFGIHPLVASILFVIELSLILITRMVAPASILACILAPTLLFIFNAPLPYTISLGLIGLFIIYRHKSNIVRLLQGKENKL